MAVPFAKALKLRQQETVSGQEPAAS